jgi:hypothetical protein
MGMGREVQNSFTGVNGEGGEVVLVFYGESNKRRVWAGL